MLEKITYEEVQKRREGLSYEKRIIYDYMLNVRVHNNDLEIIGIPDEREPGFGLPIKDWEKSVLEDFARAVIC